MAAAACIGLVRIPEDVVTTHAAVPFGTRRSTGVRPVRPVPDGIVPLRASRFLQRGMVLYHEARILSPCVRRANRGCDRRSPGRRARAAASVWRGRDGRRAKATLNQGESN